MSAAPTDISLPRTGRATLEVELVAGESAVTSAFASSPMKLLAPRSRGQSVWVYTSSFGGGLVAGDQTRLDLRIGAGARCFCGTQASTKVYRNPNSRPCGHTTHAVLEAGSLLAFAPDPVQAYAGSSYAQRQTFHMAADAGLVLMDWFTAGRAACGERWAFSRFQSRNEVFIAGERAVLDSLVLDPADGTMSLGDRMGRFHCVALLLLLGSQLSAAAKGALEHIAARPVGRRETLVASASPVRDGALLRVAGESVEDVGRELRAQLDFLSDILGDDPWARKW
jgi:urease accessory protein